MAVHFFTRGVCLGDNLTPVYNNEISSYQQQKGLASIFFKKFDVGRPTGPVSVPAQHRIHGTILK